MTPLFPITKCKHCGAAVRRMDERLYRIDAPVIHICASEADGTPLTLYAEDPSHKPHA